MTGQANLDKNDSSINFIKWYEQPRYLKPVVQNYKWGKKLKGSLIGKLLLNKEESSTPYDKNLPYAELWFGAHPKGSSLLELEDDKYLSFEKALSKHSDKLLGEKSINKFGNKLPYLFKILSVNEPLSIQVHPDKKLAKFLHSVDPKNYPDSNHKPEIGIAHSEVEMLCAFREKASLTESLSYCPELRGILKNDLPSSFLSLSSSQFKELTEKIYRKVMLLSDEEVKTLSKKMIERVNLKAACPQDEWVKKAALIYPEGDVGFFSFYLLNIIKLKPGEAVFSLPGVPHAYLSGDLIECMANCDNTIRAGLTPKFKDVDTLLDMVDYGVTSPCYIEAEVDGLVKTFKPEVEEFSISEFNFKKWSSVELSEAGPAIVFCLEGFAEMRIEYEDGSFVAQPFEEGEAVFIPHSSKSPIFSAEGRVYAVYLP